MTGNMKLADVLFLIFLVLKCTDLIDWSWWWVFSPLLVGLVAGFLVAFEKASRP